MKKITKSIIALSVLAGLASCVKEQTPVAPEVNDGKIALSLTATQENPETRTYAGETTTGDDGKKTTPVLWSEDDCLSVLEVGYGNNKFDLTGGIGESTGTFKGTVTSTATSLVVVHPYSDGLSFDQSTMTLSGAKLEENQTATAGSFDPKTAALMAGVVPATSRSSSSSVELENVVGYVKVTPKFDCKKITLESKSADDKLSGTVSAEYKNGGLTFTSTESANKVSISGDIEADKTYYIAVLPVNMESGFKLSFTLTDDTEKYREGTKTLNIGASEVWNLGEIKDTDLKVDCEDLSATESANCYLIQKAGTYKFLAVKGNSTTSVGTVNSVEVLWESFGTDETPSVGALIASVSYSDGYIQFSTPSTFKQGNAVIAAKDASNNILWSWHIWCATEGWEEQTYWANKVSGTKAGTMMDRNLGATSATAGEVGSLGLLYQWGRKDPFLGSSSVSSSTQALSTGTWPTPSDDTMIAENTTQNPMTFYKGDSNGMPDNSWGWTSEGTKKAVNDPCPAGWRVPDGGNNGIWATASGKTSNFNITAGTYGLNFGNTFGSDETIWYPASGFLSSDSGALSSVGDYGSYWSGTPDPSFNNSAYCFDFFSYGDVFPSSGSCRSFGVAVRCQKIEQTEAKTVVNLSEAGTANCYLVQEAGDYKFKAVKGNSSTSVGDVSTVEVLWESFGTDETPSVGEIISSVSYSDDYIQFSTPSTFAQGNAVIAAKDASNNILWSWHIWCATEKWTEQIYNNSAGTMMDRNLGATSATQGDVGSLGLLYQWGRKDPFLGSSSVSSSTKAASTGSWATSSDTMTADNTTQNPMIFYTGDSNGMPDDSWGWTSEGTKKAVNDPCPAGWRVPDGGESGIWATASGQKYNFTLSFGTYGMDFSSTFGTGSTAAIWYPASGYLNDSRCALISVGIDSYYWSVTPKISDYWSTSSQAYSLAFDHYSGGRVYTSNEGYRSNGYSVRCLQE